MFEEWRKRRKIARMPGVSTSPETVLAQMLECARAGHLAGVVISLRWKKDDTYTVACSNMSIAELSLHTLNVQTKATAAFQGDEIWEETKSSD